MPEASGLSWPRARPGADDPRLPGARGTAPMDSSTTAALTGFPVVIRLPVQWGDQDAFGHVNNTVFLRWFESARIAYFGRMGLLEMMARDRVGPILASIACDYRRPVTHPDTVHVGA